MEKEQINGGEYVEHVSFEDAIREKTHMGVQDASLAAEALISKLSIDNELLRAQVANVTAYAKELYEQNLLLKATQAPQEEVETFSKEGSGEDEQR